MGAKNWLETRTNTTGASSVIPPLEGQGDPPSFGGIVSMLYLLLIDFSASAIFQRQMTCKDLNVCIYLIAYLCVPTFFHVPSVAVLSTILQVRHRVVALTTGRKECSSPCSTRHHATSSLGRRQGGVRHHGSRDSRYT